MENEPQYFMTDDGRIWRREIPPAPPTLIGAIIPEIRRFMLLNDVQLSQLLEIMEDKQNYEECAHVRNEIKRRNTAALNL